MEVETTEVPEGVRIEVICEDEFAVSVHDGDCEEIYLSGADGSNTTYYTEKPYGESSNSSFVFIHHGEVDEVEIISS